MFDRLEKAEYAKTFKNIRFFNDLRVAWLIFQNKNYKKLIKIKVETRLQSEIDF